MGGKVVNFIIRWSFPAVAGLATCMAQIQFSSNALSFEVVAGGEAPVEQRILVVATSPAIPVTFSVRADGGSLEAPAPTWLSYGPRTLTTPALVRVNVDPAGMTAGTQPAARLLLTTQAGIGLGAPIPVNVTVAGGAPRLVVTPENLRFYLRLAQRATLEQDLLVRNAGPGGLQPFAASVKSNSAWLRVSVSTPCDKECLVHAAVDGGPGLAGTYEALIEVTTAAGTRQIPVSAQVASAAPALALDPSAIEFEARAGHGLIETRTISVLNLGESTAHWDAQVMSGGSWLSLETSSGSSAPAAPSSFTFTVNAAGVGTGTHYALLKITSAQAPNSPLFLPVVLRVSAAASPWTTLTPAGLVFTAPTGTAAPPPVPVAITTSNTAPALYFASIQVESGTGWLSMSPQIGSVSTGAPATAMVSVSTAGLGIGVYTGKLNFWMSGSIVRSLNITLVVSGSLACTPSAVAVTSLSLPDNFSAEVGDHVPLAARLTNNCGAPVLNGSVAVEFSNGDKPLSLRHRGEGVYGGHWSPLHTASSMSVTLMGSMPTLTRASKALLVGAVAAASGNQPALALDATLNNLNPKPGAAVAIGTISQVYGLGLAGAPAQTSFVNGQLPTTFDGTTAYVGGVAAPLYYVSDGQLNVQIPYDLAPEQPHQILVERDGAYSVTDTILVTAAAPGVAAFPDGRVIAQHNGGILVDATNPAQPGETVVIYLVGMGQTDPAATSGQQVSGALQHVLEAPKVTLDGAIVIPDFAGLTPFFAGLYQINLPVPANARTGDLKLVISQKEIWANETFLPVQ
jgi:uncharacterized protein (TIGR03437 family)